MYVEYVSIILHLCWFRKKTDVGALKPNMNRDINFLANFIKKPKSVLIKSNQVPCPTSLMDIAACRARLFDLLMNQLLKHYWSWLGCDGKLN